MSLGGATQGPKMGRFFDFSTCPPDDHSELSFMANPTGAGKRSRGGSTGGAESDDSAGKRMERKAAMLANLGIVAACAAFNALCGGVPLGYKVLAGWTPDILQAFATVRFPSFSLFPSLFMMQNVLEPAIHLLVYDPIAGHKTVAVGVILIVAWLPAACWYITSPVRFQALYVADPGMRGKSRLPIFLWGDHKWISADQDGTFERRYALLFKDFTYKCRRFLLVDMAVVVMISVLSAFIARNIVHCTVQIALASLVEIVYVAAVIKYRPFITDLDHWYTIIVTCCQIGAIALALVAMHSVQQGLLGVSAGLLILATFLMLVKGLFDLYTFLRDRCAEEHAAGQPQLQSAGGESFGIDASRVADMSLIGSMSLLPGSPGDRDTSEGSRGRRRSSNSLLSPESPAGAGGSFFGRSRRGSADRRRFSGGRGITLKLFQPGGDHERGSFSWTGSAHGSEAEAPRIKQRRTSAPHRNRAGTVSAAQRLRRKARNRGSGMDDSQEDMPALSRSMCAPPTVPICGPPLDLALKSPSPFSVQQLAGAAHGSADQLPSPTAVPSSPRRRRVTAKLRRVSMAAREDDSPRASGSPTAADPRSETIVALPQAGDGSEPASPALAAGLTVGRGRRMTIGGQRVARVGSVGTGGR